MVTATVPELRQQDRTGRIFVLARDRTSELRRARRRSLAVRAMRWGFPALGIALIGGYALSVLRTAGFGASLPEITLRKILPKDLAMNNPRYEGFGKDGSAYTFTAKTARQDLAQMNIISLDSITGWVVQPDKTRTELAAPRGTFDHEASMLELYDDINVTSESGLKAKLTRATVNAKESLITSPEPVVVSFPSGTIRSNTMTLRQKLHEVSFVDNVQVALTPERVSAAAQKPGGARSDIFSRSDEPIDIVANRLDVNDASKIAVFSGKVKAVQGTATLTTPEMELTYNGSATEKPQAADGAPPEKNPASVRRIIAKNPVVMTRGESDVVTSEQADFDAEQQTTVLTGNVVITSGTERRATSERADLDQRAETALLTGNVVVVQGKNELKGGRLFVDRKAGQTHLTSPPEAGTGPGRVAARLYRGETKQPAKTKTGEASGSASGLLSFKTDPNAPIEIEANQLDVNDTAKVAVFSGDVSAVQGDFSIRSAELHAFYKGGAGLADVTASSAEAKDGQAKHEPGTELTRVEAKRDVFIMSKRGQTAKGDWAELDVKANTVLVGGDVIVSQGQNLVRGTRLVIDMTSGESTIDTAPANTAARPSGGGWVTQAPASEASEPENSGRASAVFYPQQLRENGDGKKAPQGAGTSTPDGWSSSTDPLTPGASGN